MTASIADGALVKQHVSNALASELVPKGAVSAFAGSVPPAGWLKCDGSTVSRTSYAALFAVIGVAHGSGDGSTTFQVPDYRGRFLRGVNETANSGGSRNFALNDPDANSRTAMAPGGATGNTVGSVQSDAFSSHSHMTDGTNSGNVHPVRFGSDSGIDYWSGHATADDAGYIPGSHTGISGGSETRPTNAYVIFIIKY